MIELTAMASKTAIKPLDGESALILWISNTTYILSNVKINIISQ